MPNLVLDKVEVYVFRRGPRGVEFLALRRAAGKSLPGVWQPVTGKIELLETIAEAAQREVREETGFAPLRWWRLERISMSLDPKGRSVMVLPLLAAEVGATDPLKLSKEHDAWRFVSASQAARLYLWDSQREGIAAVERQILPGGARATALELAMPRRGARARAARAAPRIRRAKL